MHRVLVRAPACGRAARSPRARRGFTLIELLVVIAIIGVLAAITFGVIGAVTRRSQESRCQAELAYLSQVLESYKRQFGDYPQTTQSDVFLQSLIGRKGPTGATIASRSLLESARVKTEDDKDPFTEASAKLVDPWGTPYTYSHTKGATTYTLTSAGADTTAGSADDLYANR